MKIYKALIGKTERECGHEHRTSRAAYKCGRRLASLGGGLFDAPGSYRVIVTVK